MGERVRNSLGWLHHQHQAPLVAHLTPHSQLRNSGMSGVVFRSHNSHWPASGQCITYHNIPDMARPARDTGTGVT